MSKTDLIKTAWNLDNSEAERAAYLSDDFRWTDEMGSPPMDKESWLAMGRLMESAFPDLSYVIEDIQETGDCLAVTGRFAGTFTNDFDLSAMGMGVIPATGAPVAFPSSTARVCFDGDKILDVHDLGNGPDAGMAGFFQTLGGGTS
jgi:predicted ester cyclase